MRPVFTDAELQRMAAPALLLIGDHEIMYPPRKALDHAARLIPGLRAEMIPNASHWLNRDQAKIVDARMMQFLLEGEVG